MAVISPLSYFTIPIGASEIFKPRMLYLLGGMLATGHYKSIEDKVMTTNVTIDQLASITGESPYYIKDTFYKFIRCHPNKYVTWNGNYFTQGYTKRNRFILIFPKANFRIIKSDIFSDTSLTVEEKGIMIGLYCLCVNNTFRYELKDSYIANKLNISLNTWKKYRNLLSDKGLIKDYTNADIGLVDPNFPDAKVLDYEYLGHEKQNQVIKDNKINTDFINCIYLDRLSYLRTGT